MEDFKNLDVWQQGAKMTRLVYQNTKSFPKDEVFGLTTQIRRASLAVISNIAEGYGRKHTKDTLRFLYMSRGSLYQVECQNELAKDFGYIGMATYELTSLNIQKSKQILNSFIAFHKNKLEHKQKKRFEKQKQSQAKSRQSSFESPNAKN
jgi:four helix bundle protein